MKKILLTVLVALCVCTAFAQTDKDKYNSVCLFVGGGMETSLTSQFGNMAYKTTNGSYSWSHETADGSAAEGVVSQSDSLVFYNPYTDHIINIGEMIAPWSSAYSTPMGYFTFSSSLPYSIEGLSEGRLLSFVSFDKQTTASVVYDSTNVKPICLIVNATTIRMVYSSDECTIYIVGEDGKTPSKIGTKAMTNSSMTDYIAAYNADNDLTIGICRLLAAAESSAVSYPSEVSDFITQVKSLLSLTCNSYESESQYYLPNDGESFAFISDMAKVEKIISIVNSGNEPYTEEEGNWGQFKD